MRPGEILVGPGEAPESRRGRATLITVANRGRFVAYLTSHFPIARASCALELDREPVEGARPMLPAGASVAIEPGESIELEITWD